MFSHVLALLAFAVLPVQDAPPAPADKPLLTLQNELTLKLFIEKLEGHGWGGVKLRDVEVKTFKVDVKEAGFCRVMDELCRRHGNATYFRPQYRSLRASDIAIHGEPWIEYPTSYHGHYKVIVSHFVTTKRRTADGDQEWLTVRMVIFGPPWARIIHSGPSRPTWTLETVQGPDGRELKPDPGSDEWDSIIEADGEDDDWEGNLLGDSLNLKSPGADRTLKILRGKANPEVSEIFDARMTFRADESVDAGPVTIRIARIDPEDEGWVVRCVAERKAEAGRKTFFEILERVYRHEGGRGWLDYHFDDRPGDKRISFEVNVRAKKAPEWIEFRVLRNPKRVEIPFSFENVKFAK